MGFTQKIKQIQGSDEKTKLRWLILATAASMVVVVAVWVAYTKSVVSNASGQPLVGAAEEKPGFFKILGAGVSSIIDNLRKRTANTVLYFDKRVSKENTIVIKPAATDQP